MSTPMTSQNGLNWNRAGLTMLNVFLVAGLFYSLFIVAMFLMQRSFMYYPDTELPSLSDSNVPEMQEITLKTSDDLDLVSWYAAPSDPARPVVILFHGNAGNIGDRGYKARLLLDRGYGVLLAEYRGFSGNPGTPDEPGLMADGRAAIDYLLGVGISESNMVVYGESLGTGVAVKLAIDTAFDGKPFKAMVLEAPFSSAVDAARAHYPFLPVKMFLKDRFESEPLISAVRTPVFIFHGDQDWTIPIRLGKKLFAAAQQPKQSLWIKGAGHNNLFDFGAGEAVLGFLNKVDSGGF